MRTIKNRYKILLRAALCQKEKEALQKRRAVRSYRALFGSPAKLVKPQYWAILAYTRALFDILHLLAQLLNLVFHFYTETSHSSIRNLRG